LSCCFDSLKLICVSVTDIGGGDILLRKGVDVQFMSGTERHYFFSAITEDWNPQSKCANYR